MFERSTALNIGLILYLVIFVAAVANYFLLSRAPKPPEANVAAQKLKLWQKLLPYGILLILLGLLVAIFITPLRLPDLSLLVWVNFAIGGSCYFQASKLLAVSRRSHKNITTTICTTR